MFFINRQGAKYLNEVQEIPFKMLTRIKLSRPTAGKRGRNNHPMHSLMGFYMCTHSGLVTSKNPPANHQHLRILSEGVSLEGLMLGFKIGQLKSVSVNFKLSVEEKEELRCTLIN